MMEYTSVAHREGRWWIVQCDQLPGALSQVTRLDKAEEAQREAIAFVAQISPSDVTVRVRASINPEVDEEVLQTRRMKEEIAAAETRAAAQSRALAARLAGESYSLREIGFILGVSHQRVGQLLNEDARGSAAARRS
ncbi:hypothetical protein HQQ81_17995 [Microbacteriaceae bacterium VKM Ac-2854]|nr:hypothetical protein [Microbacteriaceae bacterium VKM Ac-2854]